MTTGKKIALSVLLLTGVGVAAYYFTRGSVASSSLLPSGGSGTGTNLPSGGSGTTTKGKYPAGTLLRTHDRSDDKNRRVYYIDANGLRHHVLSKARLTAMGLDINKTLAISLAELEAIPAGADLAGIPLGSLTYSMN